MGLKVTRRLGLKISIELKNLRGYKKTYEELANGKLIEDAARFLQAQALRAMAITYAGSRGGYKSRHTGTLGGKNYVGRSEQKKIEHHLFKGSAESFASSLSGSSASSLSGALQGYSLRKTGKTSVEISVFPGSHTLSSLYRLLPHLRWQERGRKSTTVTQMYLDPQKLRRKEKWKAITKTEWKSKSIDGIKNVRNKLKSVQVTHDAQRARKFILAAQNVLKNQGRAIVLRYIRREVNRLYEKNTKNA